MSEEDKHYEGKGEEKRLSEKTPMVWTFVKTVSDFRPSSMKPNTNLAKADKSKRLPAMIWSVYNFPVGSAELLQVKLPKPPEIFLSKLIDELLKDRKWINLGLSIEGCTGGLLQKYHSLPAPSPQKFIIIGYSDWVGGGSLKNVKLREDRAKNLKKHMIAHQPRLKPQITATHAYQTGQQKSFLDWLGANSQDTPQGRSENRSCLIVSPLNVKTRREQLVVAQKNRKRYLEM